MPCALSHSCVIKLVCHVQVSAALLHMLGSIPSHLLLQFLVKLTGRWDNGFALRVQRRGSLREKRVNGRHIALNNDGEPMQSSQKSQTQVAMLLDHAVKAIQQAVQDSSTASSSNSAIQLVVAGPKTELEHLWDLNSPPREVMAKSGFALQLQNAAVELLELVPSCAPHMKPPVRVVI